MVVDEVGISWVCSDQFSLLVYYLQGLVGDFDVVWTQEPYEAITRRGDRAGTQDSAKRLKQIEIEQGSVNCKECETKT